MFDLGPVEHADIRLRPLTVLTGPAGTGKSTAARALHAALRTADRFNAGNVSVLTVDQINDTAAVSEHLDAWADVPFADLPDAAQAHVMGWLDAGLGDAAHSRRDMLAACFEVRDSSGLLRRGSDRRTPVVELLTVAAGVGSDTAAAANAAVAAAGTYVWPTALAAPRNSRDAANMTPHLARSACERYLASVGVTGVSWHLPAGRAALMPLWRYLRDHSRGAAGAGAANDFVADLVAAASRRGRNVDDGAAMWDMPNIRGAPIDCAAAVDALRAAAGGAARIVAEPGFVHDIAFESDGRLLPLHLTSATALDTIPLMLWAEHLLSVGDTLIVEEPAAAAAPEAVRATARALIRLVNAGVAVVCSTNRSELLHEISNAVLRHTADEPGDRLDVDNVSVWRFARSDSQTAGCVADAVDIDPSNGIPELDNIAAAEALSSESARLIGLIAA